MSEEVERAIQQGDAVTFGRIARQSVRVGEDNQRLREMIAVLVEHPLMDAQGLCALCSGDGHQRHSPHCAYAAAKELVIGWDIDCDRIDYWWTREGSTTL